MNQLLLVIVLAVLVAGSGLALVYSKHQSRILYSALEKLQQQHRDLGLEYEQLLLQQSRLSALVEVDRKAREQLNMFVPLPEKVIYLQR